MDLYEYQGKELFRRFGIPVSEGRLATTPQEARAAAQELGGQVVVKAQVLTGGRGKAGGVKLAEDVPADRFKLANRIVLFPALIKDDREHFREHALPVRDQAPGLPDDPDRLIEPPLALVAERKSLVCLQVIGVLLDHGLEVQFRFPVSLLGDADLSACEVCAGHRPDGDGIVER